MFSCVTFQFATILQRYWRRMHPNETPYLKHRCSELVSNNYMAKKDFSSIPLLCTFALYFCAQKFSDNPDLCDCIFTSMHLFNMCHLFLNIHRAMVTCSQYPIVSDTSMIALGVLWIHLYTSMLTVKNSTFKLIVLRNEYSDVSLTLSILRLWLK